MSTKTSDAAPSYRGALPNGFNDVINSALNRPGATAESVAEAIAKSNLFIRAVRIGMLQPVPEGSWQGAAPNIRGALAKAFSAAAGGAAMFSADYTMIGMYTDIRVEDKTTTIGALCRTPERLKVYKRGDSSRCYVDIVHLKYPNINARYEIPESIYEELKLLGVREEIDSPPYSS